jgi:hypothetical protein
MVSMFFYIFFSMMMIILYGEDEVRCDFLYEEDEVRCDLYLVLGRILLKGFIEGVNAL